MGVEVAVIFHPDLAEKVLAGEKTVTRRPVQRDREGRLKPCRYRPGRTYAVQDRRGGKQLGRIKVISAYREILSLPLRAEEAAYEGFESSAAFRRCWIDLYGSTYPVDVWRIVFRVA